jgi:hypothetical protein
LIWILQIIERLSLCIDGLFHPDDIAADLLKLHAAALDPDSSAAILGEPGAVWVDGTCGDAGANRSRQARG